MSEIIFEVHEDETDGGYYATALGHAIATQGETLDELREMVRDAVQCHFGDGEAGEKRKSIRLPLVRDELIAVLGFRGSFPVSNLRGRCACLATTVSTGWLPHSD